MNGKYGILDVLWLMAVSLQSLPPLAHGVLLGFSFHCPLMCVFSNFPFYKDSSRFGLEPTLVTLYILTWLNLQRTYLTSNVTF